MAVLNKKGNQSPKFANFHSKNIIVTRKTTYETRNYMVSINEC